MKLSDPLVQALISLDVHYVFGVRGANIEHLHDAIHRLRNGALLNRGMIRKLAAGGSGRIAFKSEYLNDYLNMG